MVNLTAAIGGMAIALTVDRFGHRRLVVLGTALCCVASLLGAFAGSIDLLLVWRFLEGLGFIVVTVSVPTLVLRVTEPHDRHRAMTIWTSYMPAGAGAMMLIAAVILPGTSWRAVWLVASAASLAMLAALLLRAVPRHELDAQPANRRPILHEMAEVATSGGPLAIAICFGAYSCCWLAIVGFLPTLQVERLGFSTADGGDRHGAGDGGERRRQPFGRRPAAARPAARRGDRRGGDLHGVLRRRHLRRRRARPVAPGAGRRSIRP